VFYDRVIEYLQKIEFSTLKDFSFGSSSGKILNRAGFGAENKG
jgi:hypothetical protein